MAQLLVPTSDQATGLWTNAPLWSKADADDDTDAVSDAVGNNSDTSNADLKLASGTTPEAGTQTLRARWHHDLTGRSMQATCELYQGDPAAGGSLIATLQSANDVGTTETEDSTTVSGITDYSDLYVRLRGRGTGGGPSRSLHVDLVELSIPDGGASPVVVQASPASLATGAQAATPSLSALAVQAAAATMSPAAQVVSPSASAGGGIKGTSTAFVSDASVQYSVTTPAETVDGDLLVLFQHHGGGDLDLESEWGEVGTDWTFRETVGPLDNESVAVWTKPADATDASGGGSYAFQTAVSDALRWVIVAIPGGAYDNHVTVADADVTTSPSVSGTIDPVAASTMLLAFLGKDENSASNPTNTWSSVQGMTEEEAHSDEGDVLFTSLFSEELTGQVTRDFDLANVSGSCKLILLTATFDGAGTAVQASPAAMAAGAQAASPAFSALAVPASPAILSPAAQSLNPALAAKTVQAAPAVLSPAAQAVDKTLAALAVQANPGTLITAAQTVDTVPGALTVQASPARLTIDPQVVNPIVSGAPVVVTAAPGIITLVAQPADPALAALAIRAIAAGLSVEAQSLDPVLAELAVQAAAAGLVMVAQQVSPQAATQGVAIPAVPATLDIVSQAVDAVLAALAVTATPAGLSVSAQPVVPDRGATVVSASPGLLSSQAGVVQPVTSQLAVSAQPAVLIVAASTVDGRPAVSVFRLKERLTGRVDEIRVAAEIERIRLKGVK